MIRRRLWPVVAVAASALAATVVAAVPAHAAPSAAPSSGVLGGRVCAPAALALGYSDALDKLAYHGAELGGLSSLAWDARAGAWVSAADNNGTDPAHIWFFRDLAHPQVIRDPLG